MNKEYDMVRDFHLAFNHPVNDTPTFMPIERASIRYNWMQEELDEFLQSDNVYDQADAMIDELYFVLGTLVEMGVYPEKIFNIVHQANMTKLFPDGKPHYSSDSKVIKPENWQPPEPKIKEVIDNQFPQYSEGDAVMVKRTNGDWHNAKVKNVLDYGVIVTFKVENTLRGNPYFGDEQISVTKFISNENLLSHLKRMDCNNV